MNCDQVCHLIDDYLENRLSRYDRQHLEAHVAFCPECSEELRNRPAFERNMWQALSASVQHLYVSPEVSRRIVHKAQSSMGRAVWSDRFMVGARVFAGAAAMALLVVGVLFLAGYIEAPTQLQPLSESQASQPSVSLTASDVFVEPWVMKPNTPFTVTVFLHSDVAQPPDKLRLDLDIDGPTGVYRFGMVTKGPLPARGVSVFQITPDLLEAPCQEQYQISPSDIMSEPGVYTLRTTLFVPSTKAER